MAAKLSAFMLMLVFLLALMAPVLAPYDPGQIDLGHQGLPPSRLHLLGTDQLGRDLLSRLLYGTKISLSVGFLVAVVGSGVGVGIGALAGYASGRLDALLMRLADLMLALPTFFLLIAAQALFAPRLSTVALIIAATQWMALARLVRGRFLSLREQDFVQAARATGCSDGRIVLRHLLPNTWGQIVVCFSLMLADGILIESALSFLGLGLPPDQPSWGNMLADGRATILDGTWWVALFPGLMILWVALAANLFSDELARRQSTHS
jgi:peptide/nickel transport system permease protein